MHRQRIRSRAVRSCAEKVGSDADDMPPNPGLCSIDRSKFTPLPPLLNRDVGSPCSRIARVLEITWCRCAQFCQPAALGWLGGMCGEHKGPPRSPMLSSHRLLDCSRAIDRCRQWLPDRRCSPPTRLGKRVNRPPRPDGGRPRFEYDHLERRYREERAIPTM